MVPGYFLNVCPSFIDLQYFCFCLLLTEDTYTFITFILEHTSPFVHSLQTLSCTAKEMGRSQLTASSPGPHQQDLSLYYTHLTKTFKTPSNKMVHNGCLGCSNICTKFVHLLSRIIFSPSIIYYTLSVRKTPHIQKRFRELLIRLQRLAVQLVI